MSRAVPGTVADQSCRAVVPADARVADLSLDTRAQIPVMMPLLAERGRADAGMRERAAGLLEEVGLSDRATYPASDLSGGQQQRVAVARALVMEPPLVLADEPTGNLDSESGNQVIGLLRAINERRGTAFVIVTHDERLAARCDRVVHIVDDRVDSDTSQTASH